MCSHIVKKYVILQSMRHNNFYFFTSPTYRDFLSLILNVRIMRLNNANLNNDCHFTDYAHCVIIIRIMCKANPKAVQVFEAQLFPPFQDILQKDVLEFHPYVFQGRIRFYLSSIC